MSAALPVAPAPLPPPLAFHCMSIANQNNIQLHCSVYVLFYWVRCANSTFYIILSGFIVSQVATLFWTWCDGDVCEFEALSSL